MKRNRTAYYQSEAYRKRKAELRKRYVDMTPEERKASGEYNRAQRRKRRKQRQRWVVAYLRAHPCIDCGEPDVDVLTFDHVRGEKNYDVSRMVIDGMSWKALLAEIAKCKVRCANCHIRRTRRDQWKSVRE